MKAPRRFMQTRRTHVSRNKNFLLRIESRRIKAVRLASFRFAACLLLRLLVILLVIACPLRPAHQVGNS